MYVYFISVARFLWMALFVSFVPNTSSLAYMLLYDSWAHARLFTWVNVSALFLLLIGLDILLLLGLS